MFAVLFEVHPDTDQWDAYLGYAKMLRPDLEAIEGFVDNIRYRSLTRPGWILSLSNWRDEKALVRWRTRAIHHNVQVAGREKVLSDYHLRVGQLIGDTHPRRPAPPARDGPRDRRDRQCPPRPAAHAQRVQSARRRLSASCLQAGLDAPLLLGLQSRVLARAARFLASPASSFINGQIVPLNGGRADALDSMPKDWSK